jgi:hypothetical protein
VNVVHLLIRSTGQYIIRSVYTRVRVTLTAFLISDESPAALAGLSETTLLAGGAGVVGTSMAGMCVNSSSGGWEPSVTTAVAVVDSGTNFSATTSASSVSAFGVQYSVK